jgi:hypothetical protein
MITRSMVFTYQPYICFILPVISFASARIFLVHIV